MSFRIAATAAIVFVSPTLPAAAFEPEKLLDSYVAQLRQAGLEMAYNSLKKTGEDLLAVSGLTLTQGGLILKGESLRLEGVSETEGGGYRVARLVAGPMSLQTAMEGGKLLTASIASGSATNFLIVASGSLDLPLERGSVQRNELSGIEVMLGDVPVLTVASYASQAEFIANSDVLSLKAEIPSAHSDLAQLPEKQRGQLAAIGMVNMQASMKLSGTWDLSTGRIDLDDYRLAVKDVGALSMKLIVDGYTQQNAAGLRRISARLNNLGTANGEAKKAAGEEFKELLSGLKLASFSYAFEDAGIVGRLLAVQSQAMGITPAEIAASLPAMLEEPLKLTGSPAFAAEALQAISAFAVNAGTIELSAGPPEPVSFAALTAALLNAPRSLVSMLGLHLTATGK